MAVQANTTNTDYDDSTAGAQVRAYLRSKGLDYTAANVRDALAANARFSDQSGADPIEGLRNYGVTPDAAPVRRAAVGGGSNRMVDMSNVAPVVESGPDPNTPTPAPTTTPDSSWIPPAISRMILGGNAPNFVPSITLGDAAIAPRIAAPPVQAQIEGPPAQAQIEGPPPDQKMLTEQRKLPAPPPDGLTKSLDKATGPTSGAAEPVTSAQPPAQQASKPQVGYEGDNVRARLEPPPQELPTRPPTAGTPEAFRKAPLLNTADPRFATGPARAGMTALSGLRGGLPGMAIALGMSVPQLIEYMSKGNQTYPTGRQ